MHQNQIHDELELRRIKYPIPTEASTSQEALKRACALWALDEIMWEMQSQYDRVCQAYAELRGSLSDLFLKAQQDEMTN